MSTRRPSYVCVACTAPHHRYKSRCQSCGANFTVRTLAEAIARGVPLPFALVGSASKRASKRLDTGSAALNRILSFEGGAPSPGSTIVCAQPGSGKTTMLMGACAHVARRRRALYITVEQDVAALDVLRRKLDVPSAAKVIPAACTSLDDVERKLRAVRPTLAVVDSANALAKHEGRKVADVVSRLHALAHELGIALFVTSHVNAAGLVRGGPEVAHGTDCVLLIVGDPKKSRRRTIIADKNRAGDTTISVEIEMTARGFRDAQSTVRRQLGTGAAYAIVQSDGRAQLVEVQALVSASAGTPRKVTCSGVTIERVRVLADVLGQGGVTVGDCVVRVYGAAPEDPGALDAACFAALFSSASAKPLPAGVAFAGEVALDGSLRPYDVSDEDARALGLRLVGRPGKPLLDALRGGHLHAVGKR